MGVARDQDPRPLEKVKGQRFSTMSTELRHIFYEHGYSAGHWKTVNGEQNNARTLTMVVRERPCIIAIYNCGCQRWEDADRRKHLRGCMLATWKSTCRELQLQLQFGTVTWVVRRRGDLTVTLVPYILPNLPLSYVNLSL